MSKLVITILWLLSVSSFSVEAVEKNLKVKKKKINEQAVVETKKDGATKADPAAPCESKEDILKKLEEEKQKQKPFSLHGGNTGCSVDKK